MGGWGKSVVFHELAHALGFDPGNPLLAVSSLPGSLRTKPWQYVGQNALREYNSLFDYAPPAEYVPLDLVNGIHWEEYGERGLGSEVMTPEKDPVEPLSRLTIAFMEDIGYTVDYSNAEPFSLDDGDAAFAVSGLALVGFTLAASNTVEDPDGNGSGGFGYVWQVSSDGNTWTDVGSGSLYVVAPKDADKLLRLVATYVDSQNTSERVAIDVGRVGINNVALFSIQGTPAVGQTLSATNTTPDPDGNGTGGFSYSWQSSSDGTTWSSISGATSSSYVVAPTDEGKQLRLQVTYTDEQGFPETVNTPAGTVPLVDDGFQVGSSTSNATPILISGFAASKTGAALAAPAATGATASVEQAVTTRVNISTSRRPRWVNQTSYTLIDSFSDVNGITFTGGAAANTISAQGVPEDSKRPAFNGQLVADGGLDTDTIMGGSYRNWLMGGGIFSTPQRRRTTAVDSLIGSRGALDVFDLRTSAYTADAYSASNSGSASITNYSVGEDHIVLSDVQASYRIAAQTRTSGRGWNRRTITTGYQIFSGRELVASIAPESGTTFTGTAAFDLSVLYGQQGDPTQTLINGQQMFFG